MGNSEESRPPLKTKNHSKWQFLLKTLTFSPLMSFRGKIAVWRHLEGFLEKSEESKTPLNLKNNRGLFSDIFLEKVPIIRYCIHIGPFLDFKK